MLAPSQAAPTSPGADANSQHEAAATLAGSQMNPFRHASQSFRQLNPALFAGNASSVVAKLPHAKSQQSLSPPLVNTHTSKERSTAGCAPRARVRFVLYRCRLLDADNAVASVKFALDALVAERVLTGDGPGQITLAVEQVRVRTRADEGTWIEVAPAAHEPALPSPEGIF
jgi:hypothetical protein